MSSLSKLTLGTAQLGLNYGIANTRGKPSPEKAFDILDKALEKGIRSFDTAATYGDSETVLGEYFSNKKDVLKETEITTKIVAAESTGCSTIKIESMVSDKLQRSLERLHLDSIENLMLHRITDLYEYKDDIVSALVKIKERGYVKKIGVSVYNAGDINEMLKYNAFDCVQLPINIIDMRLIKEDLLKKLKSNAVSIYARSIFLQGLFFMKPENLPENLSGAKIYLDTLNNMCSELGVSMAELTLGYVRDINEIDHLVIGAETPEQVEENVKLQKGPQIPERYKKQINECFANVPEQYLEPWRWERDEY